MKTILIVDDDIEFCRDLANELKNLKFNSHIANSGIDAVRKYQENSYHIIIMSADLEDPDGLKTAQAIRTIERYRGARQVPIVGISIVDKSKACMDAMMSDFLTKPINQDQFKKAVIKWKRVVSYD